MKNILLFAFASFFFYQNAQASDLDCVVRHETPTQRYPIDPSHNLFEDKEQFPVREENSVVLKVTSSKPIYQDVQVIYFGDSSDSTETPNFFRMLMKNSTFFNIIFDGECVGEVKTDIMPNDLKQVYIREIEVNEQHRGRGIGTKAIELVVQFYLQKRFKIQNFGAQIARGNAASIRIFEKNDFLTDGVLGLGLFAYVLKV